MNQKKVQLEDLSNQPVVEFDQNILDNYQFKTEKEEFLRRIQNIRVVGHRGGFKPDNTMRAFKQAQQHGVEFVELDVYLSKDQEVFVIHAGHNGEMDQYVSEKNTMIGEYGSEQLQNITINDFGDKMPTLRDVIYYLKEHNMHPYIELKGSDINICQQTINVILETHMMGQAEIITFNDDFVRKCKEIIKENNIKDIIVTRVYKNTEKNPDNPQELLRFDTPSISINASELDRDLMYQIKKINPEFKLNCWWARSLYREGIRVENFTDYLYALDCPLDDITVDFPLVMQQIIQQLLKKLA